MTYGPNNKSIKRSAFILLGGLAAGFVNGLLGAGGGIIAVFVLSHACAAVLPDRRDIFANAIAVMLPVSAVSAAFYALGGKIDTSDFGAFFVPAVLGGISGGFLLRKINTALLRKVFAAVVIVSGIMMIVKR